MKILIETSARHMHLSKEHLDILFGAGAELHPKKELSQPGQFACEERVEVIGPKGSFVMSVLGPTRPETQVEISLSDARKVGIAAPIRESGAIENSGACKLKGPAGEVDIEKGVIAAQRHIHLDPASAEKAGVSDQQIVSVKTEANGRSLVFGDVICRVNPSYAAAMHVDTDESNAAALAPGAEGEIIV